METDKHPENARFEFLTTVLSRFRGCRDASTGKELPKWTHYLNGLYSSSVFLTLMNGCILQAVNYSVLSDYSAQLVYIKRGKNTDVSKVPNTSNFLKRPP